MEIVWFNERPKEFVVTLTSANITLNKAATTRFEHAYSVMLGTDPVQKLLIIKPLSKVEAVSKVIPENRKYRITVRSSYSRISNKGFMKEISDMTGLDLENHTHKFPARWDKNQDLLIVDLKGEVKSND
ncbi:MAG: hypothetical protein EA375_02495 [Acholeplasmataceae bacterium]|nr:MAG: hypothetical protein EA375_02495 [Acholeplasmataceae bacterium]